MATADSAVKAGCIAKVRPARFPQTIRRSRKLHSRKAATRSSCPELQQPAALSWSPTPPRKRAPTQWTAAGDAAWAAKPPTAPSIRRPWREFVACDILTNCRQYPKDEAPAAYKDFDAVLDSVKKAGLASEVARLKARFVIKDADTSLKGAA